MAVPAGWDVDDINADFGCELAGMDSPTEGEDTGDDEFSIYD